MGTTFRALLAQAGGTASGAEFAAVQPGGAPSSPDDVGAAQLVELEYAMRKTSSCGLGQIALGPVISVLRQQAP